jgi:DNA-binding HxlR family transcriptional regulator
MIQESVTELRKTLAQLQDFSKQLEGRIAASQSSLSSRLDELAKDSITSAVLKVRFINHLI